MWSHTWIGIWLGWAIFHFRYIFFWTTIVHRFIQSFYNMHIIEKTGLFISENSKINMNNTPTARTAVHNVTVNSWWWTVLFFPEIVQTKVLIWQHQIQGCSVKASMQPKPEFKMSMLQYIHKYISTRCVSAWEAQQVGRDRALLRLGLQSVNECVLSVTMTRLLINNEL